MTSRRLSGSAAPAAPDEGPWQLTGEARAAVRVGLWASAARCVLTYVVAPTLGVIGIVLGPVGLALQVLGAVTSTAGATRLWRLGHPARLAYAAVAAVLWLVTATALTTTARWVLR